MQRLIGDVEEIGNCSRVFELADTNYNNYLGLHETIVSLATHINVLAFQSNVDWQLKLKQLDCSNCVTNKTVYYM